MNPEAAKSLGPFGYSDAFADADPEVAGIIGDC